MMLWISQICPNASIGWDDSPRFPHKGKADIVQYNRSPEALASFLQKAKDHCDLYPEKPIMITLYSRNEWIESGYLLPDMKNGISHLEAVKKVLEGDMEVKYWCIIYTEIQIKNSVKGISNSFMIWRT